VRESYRKSALSVETIFWYEIKKVQQKFVSAARRIGEGRQLPPLKKIELAPPMLIRTFFSLERSFVRPYLALKAMEFSYSSATLLNS
jgi:hypothetical protein